MAGRQDYEQRKQSRIDRLNDAAQKASSASDAAWQRSNELAKRFEGGQPILVGHHSESSARATQKKIHNAMDRSIQNSEKAEYFRRKAEAAENNNAISSDDPNCIQKLQDKLEKLTQRHERFKAINAYYRKHKTCKGCEEVTDALADKLDAVAKNNALNNGKPIPDYELTNLGARLRDIKKRISSLQTTEAMPDETIPYGDFCQIESDVETNRVGIRFFVEIDENLKNQLHMFGFHWAYSEQRWQKLRSPGALARAKHIVEPAFEKYRNDKQN